MSEPKWRKFRKKPVVIEAYQTDERILVANGEALIGDWVMRDSDGDLVVIFQQIFEQKYEPIKGVGTAVVLTEGQIGWIVEAIRSTKENHYLGDDFDDAMDDWDLERSELHPDELVDLKALLDAVRPKG